MITRAGVVIPKSDWHQDDKKTLTVRPEVNQEYGVRPPAFRVYRVSSKNVCIPRYYRNIPNMKDTRTPPESMNNIKFHGTLRDSTRQNEAHDATVKMMKEKGGGVLSLPCGYGKTTVALAVASTMKVRTMIVVHKEFLANQWKERIRQFCPGATIGIVQQNKIETNNDFVIAMLQSLSMKDYEPGTFDSIGMLIVDEAHHICAKVFSQSLFKFCPKYTLGLSATPNRKDGLTDILHWFLGPMILAVEREMRGKTIVRVCPFKCEFFKSPPPTTRFGKISLATMITELTALEERNDFIEELTREYAKGTRRILILTDRREHCTMLASILEDLGTGLYMGGMKEAALTESATKKVIIGTFSQAHEGLDIPVLDTVILASPKSDVKQAVGRILRETTGKKNDPIIVDIKDGWGLLPSMFYKRRKMYLESGFEVEKTAADPVEPSVLTGYSFKE